MGALEADCGSCFIEEKVAGALSHEALDLLLNHKPQSEKTISRVSQGPLICYMHMRTCSGFRLEAELTLNAREILT